MFLLLGTRYVRVVGDPHLGKVFKNGVPLHRRGEREKAQQAEFYHQMTDIMGPDGLPVAALIMVGDLLDGFNIPNEVVMRTYELIQAAANHASFHEIPIILMMGNHDITRNTELVSSFDIMTKMSFPENVHFITKKTSMKIEGVDKPVLICPYDAFTPTSELFKDEGNTHYAAAFGHWDTISYGDGHNLVPYEKLTPCCDVIVTGHEHNPKTIMHGDTEIIVVGSMMPYSFAEDSEEKIYVTKTLEEFMAEPNADYKNKCLRLLVKPGEVVPEGIDALQVTIKYVTEDRQEEEQVVMEAFSMKTIFDLSMDEHTVSEKRKETLWGKYDDATQA